MTPWRLVADVGGTNVRFARVDATGAVSDVVGSPTLDFANFSEALTAYVARHAATGPCHFAAIGAAGPVDHGVVQLTNGDWRIDAGAVSAELDGAPVRVVNDLEAVGYALARLVGDDITPLINGESGAASAPKLVVNVGTGFGAALAALDGNRRIVIGCEPGHMQLALDDEARAALKIERASVEQVLSGMGIKSVWRDENPIESVQFARLFGQACGDLVLATGAWGGVYMCGSVALAFARVGAVAAFESAFADKGPMSQRLKATPVMTIVQPHAALIGLAEIERQ